jgi:hypothetical protein
MVELGFALYLLRRPTKSINIKHYKSHAIYITNDTVIMKKYL